MKAVWIFAILIILNLCSPEASSEETETTSALNGTSITYEYSSGRSYNVKFEERGISYRYLTGAKPDTWWGPFPYQAIQVDNNTYFASWFEKDYGDYVTLLINLDQRILYGSAILRGQEVHFHEATIVEIKSP